MQLLENFIGASHFIILNSFLLVSEVGKLITDSQFQPHILAKPTCFQVWSVISSLVNNQNDFSLILSDKSKLLNQYYSQPVIGKY